MEFSLEEKTSFQEISGLPLISDVKGKSDAELHAYRSGLRRFKTTIKNRKNATEEEKDCWAIGFELEDRCNAEMLSRHEAKNPGDKIGMAQFRVSPAETVRCNPLIEDRSYKGLFHPGDKQVKLDNGGYDRTEELYLELASGRTTTRLEKRGFAEVGGVSGGFSVPEELKEFFFDGSLENEIVRSRATVYPMTSQTLNVPAWNSSNHSSTLFGGFDAAWTPEAGSLAETTGALRKMTLSAHKLTVFCRASSEVLQDGIGLDMQISKAMIKTMAFNLDAAFLTGDGVAKPQGVLNSPSAVTVKRQTANQVNWQDCYTMYSRLHPACHSSKSTVFIANHECLPLIMNMVVNNNLVYIPGQFMGVSGAVPATLFGKPILFTEKVPSLGTKGDLMLCDLSQYVIGLRSDMAISRSEHVFYQTDELAFRVIVRADGMSLWDKAITPVNGSNSLSWCVILE